MDEETKIHVSVNGYLKKLHFRHQPNWSSWVVGQYAVALVSILVMTSHGSSNCWDRFTTTPGELGWFKYPPPHVVSQDPIGAARTFRAPSSVGCIGWTAGLSIQRLEPAHGTSWGSTHGTSRFAKASTVRNFDFLWLMIGTFYENVVWTLIIYEHIWNELCI